jgi:UDP-3-O-[3-hydroxymyristoyl] glucosamine N-acyltransferase
MNDSVPAYSLFELVERFGGEVVGDGSVRIARVATLENAGSDAISFLANERYLHQLKSTGAAALILAPSARDAVDRPRIICSNPYLLFARVSALLNPERALEPGPHPNAVVAASASVDPTAQIGACASIGAGARVGPRTLIGPGVSIGRDAAVGADSRLHAGVSVYDGCLIGDRVIVHSGAVIGADGFGLAFDGERWVKVPQVGRVRIGNDVEIGANTTIDRGALEDTVIEDGVKLDNQIQIAHNVRIGAHTAIAACTGIAGSVQIGRYCRIGGAVGIAGHVTIADHVEISGHTSITKSIDTRGAYSGVYPFETNRAWRRNAVHLRHLAEMARRLARLEEELEKFRGSRGES